VKDDDPVGALTTLIALLSERADAGDRVAGTWASHFTTDLRAFRLWLMAHEDELITTTGRDT
jgi:hypothetical protein